MSRSIYTSLLTSGLLIERVRLGLSEPEKNRLTRAAAVVHDNAWREAINAARGLLPDASDNVKLRIVVANGAVKSAADYSWPNGVPGDVVYALMGAVCALELQNLLGANDLSILTGPWFVAIEQSEPTI